MLALSEAMISAVTDEQLPAELAGWPAWTPDEAQLGELELLIAGAFAPQAGYLPPDADANVPDRIADDNPWPLPVTLTVPASLLPGTTDEEGAPPGHLVLTDPEGLPARRSGDHRAGASRLRIVRLPPFRTGDSAAGPGTRHVPQPAAAARRRASGARRHARTRASHPRPANPAAYRATPAPQVAGARLLLLPLVAGPIRVVGSPEALVRTVLAAARQLPAQTLVVPVPLPPRSAPDQELLAQAIVALLLRGDTPP